MKVSDRTIEAIRLLINGDAGITSDAGAPYRRGVDIEDFFKEFDVSPDIGSRWYMTESCLKRLNGSDKLKLAVEKTLHPTNYIGLTNVSLDRNIKYLNQFLEFDGYQVQMLGKLPKVIKIGSAINLETSQLPDSLNGELESWVTEHNRKCQQKLAEGDKSGAITNARSMVEELFIWILKNTTGGYDRKGEGDLIKLGNQVFARFGMDPKNVDTPLKQIISGMNSVIAGLAGLRNKASDAHGTGYRPEMRHAKLAVNSALTIVNYFSELCKDKDIQDQEALEAYYESLVDDMAYNALRGK